MTALLALSLLALAGQSSAQPCSFEHVLVAEQSTDYGPGGTGPSFRFEIKPSGQIKASARRWRVPDGVYVGTLVPDDWQRLSCLLASVVADFPKPPEMWLCPHAPSFALTDAEANRWRSRCVSKLDDRPLNEVYQFLTGVVCRAQWKRFTAAPPDIAHWESIAPSPAPCESHGSTQ